MKKIKSIAKAFNVAFSIYSKIPMPRFNWESEDMEYHLCFFPWVGACIGGLEILLFHIWQYFELNSVFFIALAIAIPLLVTGGFHLDGFMDTCDALHSYQPREKKLEILKDPHIGAFAVICVLCLMCLAAGFLSILQDMKEVCVLAVVFFYSRALSGIGVITLPSAKKQGMLQTFSDTAKKDFVWKALLVQCVLAGILMVVIQPVLGIFGILTPLAVYGYYVRLSKKEFGGITGDLAGYFVTVSEVTSLIVIAIVYFVMSM